MNTLIDEFEHEIMLLPSNNMSCEVYLWNSQIVTNKQIKERVADKLQYCRAALSNERNASIEALYLLFPVSIRQI